MKKTPPRPPGHLSAESRKIWRTLRDEFDITDTGGLEILKTGLEARDRAAAARRQIDADGLVVRDKFGQVKPHPLLACERDARAQWLSAVKQLNLDLEPLKPGPGRPPGGR